MKSRRNQKTISKIKKHKNTMKKSHCAPDANNPNSSTCYSNKKLMKLRNYWNARHPDAKIKTHDSQKIWHELRKNMSGTCNTEQCWLKQQFVSDTGDSDLLNYTFAPESPQAWRTNPNEWLNSTDIENVMRQYEHAYPCFQFLGPSPIEFDKKQSKTKCVWDELCNFDLKAHLYKGCNKIGIIFNTDPHYKSGSHWISLFINTKRGYVYFFDSVGDPAPKEVNQLIDRIIDQSKEQGIEMARLDNKTRHQRSNTECGMYSLYFIIQSLKDIHPEKKMSERIPDKEMERFREIYFNPSHQL